MKFYLSSVKNIGNMVLGILFLSTSLSMFLFYKNMLYLHIITIILMVLMLFSCYHYGIKNGFVWLLLIIFPMVVSMSKNGGVTTNELSEILLILIPGLIVGLLAGKQRQHINVLKETYISTLKTLAEATDARDSYTQGHSERVAKYAVLIAKEMRLRGTEINYLKQASLLHDIGKIAVPDSILHKEKQLSDEEWPIMKKHPEDSHRILANLGFLSPTLPIILYHHKWFNSSGYPKQEMKFEIPLAARILAVADAFDAMMSDRPYRNKLSLNQALEELEKGSGVQFDPAAVKAFKKVIENQVIAPR